MSHWTTTILLTTTLIGCLSDKQEDSEETGVTELTDSGESTNSDTAEDEPEATIWTGPSITFTKEDFADHTDPANQDAITDKVVLTRSFQGALFNVLSENTAGSTSPAGTEWAVGNTDDIENLEFQALKPTVDYKMKDAPGIPLVLHLIEEDIYLDVTFLSWSPGGSAGGFSYERTTPN